MMQQQQMDTDTATATMIMVVVDDEARFALDSGVRVCSVLRREVVSTLFSFSQIETHLERHAFSD